MTLTFELDLDYKDSVKMSWRLDLDLIWHVYCPDSHWIDCSLWTINRSVKQ